MRLHDYLEYYAQVQPDVTFCEFVEPNSRQTMSYAEANSRANQMARALLDQGLQFGDRFTYLSRNSTDMILMFYAAAKMGAIPIPLNYRLAPREWSYIINDSEATLLIADAEYIDSIQGIHNELEHIKHYVAVGGGNNSDQWIDHESWIAQNNDANLNLRINEENQLYQMYTSGTTGLPKGAMISHRSIDNNLGMLRRLLGLGRENERMLIVMPLYHAGGAVLSMAGVSEGATMVLHKDFDPTATIDSMANDGITMGLLVPAMIQACLVGVADIAERKFPKLAIMCYGASPIAEETLRQAIKVFDCDFVQVFGMTETSAVATALLPDDHQKALAGNPELLLSAGKQVLGTEIKIFDEHGVEVSRGTIGEIAIRGPQVMMGYWHLDEATTKSIKDGWMFTGDAATMDKDGYIYIQDRIKDMIVSGGENIYPREIENALFEHPDIADVAAIGVPSEKWGESILAFVVPRDGASLTTEQLIEFCRERLAGFKVPRQFEFIDLLPRNASGKVLKKELREPYWQGIDRRVG